MHFLFALLSILAIAWPALSKAQEGSGSRSVTAYQTMVRLPGEAAGAAARGKVDPAGEKPKP